MKPLLFRDLPGIKLLESEQMIADKFHYYLPAQKIDEASLALFGITAQQTRYVPPEWFLFGYDDMDQWSAEPELPDGEEEAPDDPLSATIVMADESAARQEVWRQMAHHSRCMSPNIEPQNDYGLMEYARANLGIDFSDATGEHPLRVIKLFFQQALAVGTGLMGHYPDFQELGIVEWGRKLEDEAKLFRKTRRA